MGRLIDADELKNSIIKKLGIASEEFLLESEKAVFEEIDNAPTVEAVPVRHGKYIGTEFDGYADGCPVYYEWKCSECGCVFEEEEPTYNYCPNCGAKMNGEIEEE